MKFGLVGVFCFFVDYFLYLFANLIFEKSGIAAIFTGYYLISAFIGFTVSVVVNYILSFKFVFKHKENMDRRKEFIIFLILSIIGMGLNALIVWGFTGPIYSGVPGLKDLLSYNMAYTVGKVIATAIVMVYNFVTRKKFLEQKDEE